MVQNPPPSPPPHYLPFNICIKPSRIYFSSCHLIKSCAFPSNQRWNCIYAYINYHVVAIYFGFVVVESNFIIIFFIRGPIFIYIYIYIYNTVKNILLLKFLIYIIIHLRSCNIIFYLNLGWGGGDIGEIYYCSYFLYINYICNMI